MSYNLAFARLLNNDCEQNVFDVDLQGMTLLEVIDKKIEVRERTKPNYGKQFFSLILRLREIEKSYNTTLYPKHVTDVFWEMFIGHLYELGMQTSSVKTLASQLRAVVDWASKHNAVVSNSFSDFSLPTTDNRQISLTADEVSWIYHFDIKSIKRRKQHLANLEQVRDMFILSANLGQRYSDMIRIDKSCFDRNIFTIVQQKTGNKARVNIDEFAIDKSMTYAILEKYDYNAPYTHHLSNYNRLLSELMEYVGIKGEVKIEEKVLGEIKCKSIPRREMICSHTARRTFATYNVLRGKTIFSIRRCTGHKTERAFNRYICLEGE